MDKIIVIMYKYCDFCNLGKHSSYVTMKQDYASSGNYMESLETMENDITGHYFKCTAISISSENKLRHMLKAYLSDH